MAKRIPRRKDSFVGLHLDLHAGAGDTALGADVTEEMVGRLLRRVRPDYVQYDCKGHPGYTGYPAKVGWPSPGIVRDALAVWRRVTRRNGVGLYVHYSGVWDGVAVEKHPEWARVDEDGNPDARITSTFGPYVDELLIPQLKDIAEEYDLDGVWVDGDCWAVQPDFSEAAAAAFRRATGSDELPAKAGDPHRREFLELQREQFRRYLKRYVDALHEARPGFQVCSNWMFSTKAPDPVSVPVDFLSGDFTPGDSVNSARLEARYLASTGMPWDLMAWGFNRGTSYTRAHKTAAQLKQEAAVVLSQGGGFQVYYNPTRRGWVEDGLVETLAEVARFCRARKAVSFRTETVPQVALLLSTESLYGTADSVFGNWGEELHALTGTLHALLELGHSVDVLAEHQLMGKLADYPLVVLPECPLLAREFRRGVEAYLADGGRVLALGAGAARVFGPLLGARLDGEPVETQAYLNGDPPGWAGGIWQSVTPGTASVIARRHPTLDLRSEGDPAATVARCGRGRIGAVYGPLGSVYHASHHPALRGVLGRAVSKLFPKPMVKLDAPPCIDLSLRRKGRRLLIHLANTAGMQLAQNYPVIDFVPPVGPIEIALRLPTKPKKVRLVGQPGTLRHKWSPPRLRVKLERIETHVVLVVD